ncbi:hypothetical protein NMY22_g15038 [Coprinellus aureogranulatus]|nr:hypothetical protein NMY22_g15038 [Coprinellus aureogranulatus]
MFPSLLELRLSIAGERIHTRELPDNYGSITPPPMPSINHHEEVVPDGLLERLTEELRKVVEADLSCGEKRVPPPIGRRIKNYLENVDVQLEGGTDEDDQLATSFPEVASLARSAADAEEVYTPTNTETSGNSSPASLGIQELPDSEESPLDTLRSYFEDLDDEGIPLRKPATHLDVLLFLSSGFYSLPPTLRTLTVVNCFDPESSEQRLHAQGLDLEEQQEFCVDMLVEELSQRYPELASYSFAADDDSGPDPYTKFQFHWEI